MRAGKSRTLFLDRFLPGLGDDVAVDVYVCPYAGTSRGELAAVSLLALRSRSSRSGSGTMHAGRSQRESTEEGRGIHDVCLAAVNTICENVRSIYCPWSQAAREVELLFTSVSCMRPRRQAPKWFCWSGGSDEVALHE